MSQQLAPGGQPGPTWPAHPRPWPRPLSGPPTSYPTGLSQASGGKASVDGKPIGQPRGRPNDTLTDDPQALGELPATRPQEVRAHVIMRPATRHAGIIRTTSAGVRPSWICHMPLRCKF
ncbi:hypothetical protein PtA15_7A273 [Puccinia triticina]|uniref:Uncharacterized protein n=1 Tax=Puccinia triticina TaxID=208348 RepID=A0ABY7CV03_9BASI|nr:uncharacterized protein PtA15_7A273 [Puccinia triticina]WAQ86547.1 hypothetical protein PtA15_7A273 [Puccinia triticina]